MAIPISELARLSPKLVNLRSDPLRYAWVKSILRQADKTGQAKKTGRGALK